MLPLGGTPAVELAVAEAAYAGADAIIVSVRPDDNIIERHLDQSPYADSTRCVPRNTELPGNAGGLVQLRASFESCDSFGVLFGDEVCAEVETLATMRSLLSSDVEAVVLVKSMPDVDISTVGIVVPNDDGVSVGSIVQRPSSNESGRPLILLSRLVLRPSIFEHIVLDTRNGELDLGLSVARLAQSARVLFHELSGSWYTVGDPTQYARAVISYKERE